MLSPSLGPLLLLPGIPGKLAPPEVPQTYHDTALVLWKPGDSRAPCTYTLERRVDGEGTAGWGKEGGRPGDRRGVLLGKASFFSRERPLLWRARVPSVALTLPVLPAGESVWHSVSSGILDCYYNVTHLPVGVTVRFRVACSNRAGQGPFSNPSEKVLIRGPQGQWKV